KGDCSKRTIARDQRNYHARPQALFPKDVGQLAISDRELQPVGIDVLIELGPSRSKHVGHTDRRIGIERKAALKRASCLDLGWIAVRHRQLSKLAAILDYMDRAPIRQLRHCKLCYTGKRRFVVKRGREQAARFGQKAFRVLGAFALSDVHRDAAHPDGVLGIITDYYRLRFDPYYPAVFGHPSKAAGASLAAGEDGGR